MRERGSAHVEKLIRLRKQEQEKEAIHMVNQIVVNIIYRMTQRMLTW